jgi:CotH kinase protein
MPSSPPAGDAGTSGGETRRADSASVPAPTPAPRDAQSEPPPQTSPASDPASDPVSDPGASDELYDPERVPRFDLELDATARAALARNPRAYVKGNFRYGNEVVAEVGIRLKGEATLRPLTEKAPFKIKFGEYVPDQSFRGLRRMTLNNLTEDASFIAERLAYEAFRAAKLPAPRANNALVFVNGEAYGGNGRPRCAPNCRRSD